MGRSEGDIVESFRSTQRRVVDFCRGVSYATALLHDKISPAAAMAAVRARLGSRAGTFLETVEQTIFAHVGSPYRPLLDAAEYDLGRLRELVARSGVEATLQQLCRDGVYVSIEEFKGLREARRRERIFRFHEQDFNNPLVRSGFRQSSGGTRSSGLVSTTSAAIHRLEAEHTAVALATYGLEQSPVAIWFPEAAGGVALRKLLALAAVEAGPLCWFTQTPGRFSSTAEPYSYYLGIRAGALARGVKLPHPTYVPFGEESRILPWIAGETSKLGCALYTTPSLALRLARAARQAGASLAGVTFMTLAEPLTQAKLAAIESVGGRAFSVFAFTEFGPATWGCASPRSADDTHICRDAVAVIARRRPVDSLGSEVDALLFTSLPPQARRILLNVETGDYATMTEHRCGCLLQTLGWIEHLQEIRSFEKLNAEGRFFLGSHVIGLLEEVLPRRFGGDPADYQLVEHEDAEGYTRMSLLMHPRLGSVDEHALLACVEQTFTECCHTCARVWKEVGTLRVARAAPILTRGGKLMPLHLLGQDQPLDPIPPGVTPSLAGAAWSDRVS